MDKPSPLYRVDIVPLTVLFGRRDPRFSYVSEAVIPPGSLVTISFGKRTLTGVTLECTPLPGPVPNWMKYVGPVLLPGLVTEAQLALAWWLSDTLYVPLGLVLKLFIPLSHKPRVGRAPLGALSESKKSKSKSSRSIPKRAPTHIWKAVRDDSELLKQLVVYGKRATQDQRLLCILVPEILSAELYAEKLRAVLPDSSIRSLTSRQTPKQHYELFETIREGTVNIIVGTRQTVFAPLHNLSALVVVDTEKQLSYMQWEMTPRYDAVEIAKEIARRERVPYIQLSVAPGIGYFLPETKHAGAPFTFSATHSSKVIDMRRHYQRGRATRSLSPELLESLQTNRSARKSALILVKQRGVARFSFCAQCKTPIHCPRCQATMTEANEGHFRCLSCGYQTGTFPSCAACGHMHFKHFGAGTQKIVRELERSGLGSRIIVIDRDTQAHKAGFTDLLVTLANLSPDHIIVATYDSAYSLPLPPLGLVALVEPDQGLFYPDFQSAERLWRELRRFGGKLMLHGMLWVQTFEPEAAHWTTWVTQPLALTAQSLLEERKSLHYPPYYQLIQLECFPTKSLSSAALADLVETYIRKLKLTEITILPKYLPFSQKNRYHILIRIPKNVPLPPALHTALHTLDAAVRITRNPLSL